MNALLGQVTLRPGRRPALQHARPAGWLQRLTEGRPADELPALVATVHTLCAHGHWLAARLALRAAQADDARPSADEHGTLALAVARDHLLRLAHDWPRLLPGPALPSLPLHEAPPWQTGLREAERLAHLPGWLQQHWLGEPAATLQAALEADPVGAALAWARRTPTALARLLARELPPALALPTPHRPLRLADATLPAGTPLRLPADAVPDTGPWCRHHDSQPAPAHNAGMRLIARLLDLLRLAAPGGSSWLWAAGHTVAPGRGRAWVEVGRGLLGYEVQLGNGFGPPRVEALTLLSPTDWNLHPQGVLAEALAGVHDSDSATRLAVAFDPCVPFSIDTLPEPVHA